MNAPLFPPRLAKPLWSALVFILSLLCTAPAAAQTGFIPASARIDTVYDHKRDIVYISNGNQVLRWNLGAGQFLPPFTFRVDSRLFGMDLSPDDNTLVVADATAAGGFLWVWKVDLQTGGVTQKLIPQDFYESGSYTVAFGGDGAVLITTNFAGSGWTPLRRWDPVTDTLTVLGSVRQSSMLRASADGSVIGWAESNISDGRLGRYRVADGHLLPKSGYGDGTAWFNFEIAANRNGTQYGLPTYGGTFLYDANLVKSPNVIGTYAGQQPIGIAYHPTQDLVYFPWAQTTTIRIYNSVTRAHVGTYDFLNTFDHTGNGAFGEGRVKVARDGSLLLCTVAGGVRFQRLSFRQPIGHPLVVRTMEDTPVALVLSGGAPAPNLQFQVSAQPAHGTLSGTAPNLEYTPNPNFAGIDSFQFQVQGTGTGWSAPCTVTIGVGGVNDAPSFQMGADQLVAFNSGAKSVANWATQISPGPPDEAGQTVSFLVSNDKPALFSAAPAISPTGTLTFTPAANQTGTATVTVRLKDNGGTANGGVDTSAPQTFTITVSNNQVPTPEGDSVSTPEDTKILINVLANDTDPEGHPLTLVSIGQVVNGTARIVNGQIEYTPNQNYHGTDRFSYTVDDGQGGTANGLVAVQVTPVNDAPTASNNITTINEDTRSLTRLVGSDVDGDPLTYIIVTPPAHGTLDGTPPSGLYYTPNPEYSGPDSFTYKVNDGQVDSNVATFSITVRAVNDVPVAAADSYETDEDVTLDVPAPGLLGNDRDVDSTTLYAGVTSKPSNGTLTLRADGSFTYVPNPNFHGTDRFMYVARDEYQGQSAAVTVTLTVRPVPDLPVARDDSFNTVEDGALTVAAPGVLGNDSDADGDALSAVLEMGPGSGTLSLNPDGSFRYMPNPEFSGTDQFTYRAAAGGGISSPATVRIVVAKMNDAPTAGADQATTAEDTAAAILVLGNDSDPDGDPLSITAVTQGAHGSVQISGGQVVYTPALNWHGTDSFTYTLSDGQATAQGTVTVTVTPVNDAPSATPGSHATDEDTPAAVTLAGSDVDGDPLTFEVVGTPAHGVLSGSAPNLTYTPNANFNEADSFTFQVRDGVTVSAPATVTLTVRPVNDAPAAGADAAVTPEDTPLEIAVLANDTDVDGDTLAVDSFTQGARGTVTLVGSNLRYTPALNSSGADSFTYTVRDGNGDTATATVSVSVTPVNDAPVAVADSATTRKNNAVTITVLANDTDPEGDTLRVTAVSQPARGSVVINSNGTLRYTPNKGKWGTDRFTYTVSDGRGGTSQATVTVNVLK